MTCPGCLLQGEWGCRAGSWQVGVLAGAWPGGRESWAAVRAKPGHARQDYGAGPVMPCGLPHLSPSSALGRPPPMTSGPARKGAAIFGRTVSGQGQGKHRLPFLTVLTLRGMLWTLALSSTGPWRWVWRPAQARGTRLAPEELGLPAGQRTRVGRCLGPLTLLCSLPEPSGKASLPLLPHLA